MIRKTVLVTGASGFIGASVCKKLVESKRYDVIAVVSPFSKSVRLSSIKNKIIVKKVNLADKKSVDTLFKKNKPNVVLHLATHGVYQYQKDDRERILVDNYLMSINLLESSKKYGVEKFVNTGSVFEYGSLVGKAKETDVNLNDVLNEYSAVKMANTALGNAYVDDFTVITLRLFTAYGPDEDLTRFFKLTINRALSNEPIRIVRGVVRDFVFIDDVSEAYLNATQNEVPSGSIVNIGSGKKYTLEEVSLLIKKVTKSNSEIIIDDKYKRKRESRCYADISKARKILGWKPKNLLLLGVKKMLY